MLSPIPTKLQISLFALCVMRGVAHAAAYSTVSPYIQEAQMAINSQVTTGMGKVTSKINATKELASQKFEPQYDLKEKTLANIKALQAQNLLLLKKIESESGKTAELRSNTNLIEGSGTDTALMLGEKESGSIAAEKFN
ncbi:MAG: hypothetical protein M1300_07340 [Epsilonproteobacteria bacterium]|nr:hypothetical protein [Campylobacterota bacterium]